MDKKRDFKLDLLEQYPFMRFKLSMIEWRF